MSNEKEVTLSLLDQEKIHVLSDGPLYRDALDFIDAQGTVDAKKQLVSLLSYTQSWDDLSKFVQHQSRRNWIGKMSYYGQYYTALDSYLKKLYQQALAWFPPTDDAHQTKNAKREWNDIYAIYVAREFIQHLVFENSYRERQR
jgi:hypothetical protein